MNSKKLVEGLSDFGFVYGFGEDKVPAHLTIQDGKAKLLLLGLAESFEDFSNYGKEEVPDFAQFRSNGGNASLSHIRRANGGALVLPSGMNTMAFSCDRIVRSSAPLAYESVNGMSSRLEGFVQWSGVQVIKQSLEFQEGKGFSSALLKASLVDAIDLGSKFSASASPGVQLPGYSGRHQGEFTYRDSTKLRTYTSELRTWEEHQRIHRMFQDLMCLVYNYPCSIELESVVREDDQPELAASTDKKLWVDAFASVFGRQRHFDPKKDFSKTGPLFLLEDADRDLIAEWVDDYEKWSRPTWIAVETIFQPHLAAESRLIQIGVALEALGYAIWLYDENDGYAPECEKAGKRHRCDFIGCNKPNASRYFKRVAEKLPWSDLGISDEPDAETWAINFNEVYKGCKHADNPLPDGLEAHERAKQGLAVIRCWLAKKLGVADETLIKNKDRLKY
ncbi:HEPN domain-containing protein [Rothia nasimurium]|uniref:ApeA N-terminal domain 1-containing protein n=1 Tax=Rothia nasimurium TaxID=85336 RepID=UPI001F268F13|nr:HEPN domain-containing protein [Rothia nasimurium]